MSTDQVRPHRSAPRLVGRRLVLRAVREEDRPHLHAFLQDPSVARWWGPVREGLDVADDWLDADDDTTVWTIDVDGTVVGSLQSAEEQEPDYRHAAVDIFLGPRYQGRGLGTDAIRTVARHLFEDREHHRLTIDPSAANEQAIRAYQAVGFRVVGRMRRYERGPDGTFHDGLLMDLLREELR